MQKIKKAFISLIIVALIFNILPFKLLADTGTYIEPDNTLIYEVNNPRFNNSDKYFYATIESGNPRLTAIRDGSYVKLIYVSLNSGSSASFYTITKGDVTNTYGTTQFTQTTTYNNITFYYYQWQSTTEGNNTYYININNNVNGLGVYESAYYYTFGDGVVDPAPVILYGNLQNVGFYTKFTNSQQSNTSQMALNKDIITWDNYQDTNGNDLNDVNLRVDIQAASVDYSANTKSDLLNQTINDMLTGDWSDLITISPNVGEYSFTWETVARTLFGSNYTANWWNNLFNVFDSAQNVFYKKGWIYRIRLRTDDSSYVGDWQIIYNITSAPPSDSEKVYNNYYVYNYTIPDEETYRIINNINTVNNTNNNWYQNDVPFNPDSGSNWFEKLLEFLSQLIQNILDFFSNIFDGLVDLILGLFDNINPATSFFNWFSDLFNGIGEIDLTLPQFNIPEEDLTSFNRLVQETMNIFSFNNLGFVIFIPLLLIIIKAVF